MERRKFLQNLFGAAVVATIPIPVFNQIVNAPIPEDNNLSSLDGGDILKEFTNGSYLFIYHENKLLAQSKHFSIEFRNDICNHNIDDIDGYMVGTSGYKEVTIEASKLYCVPSSKFTESNLDTILYSVNPLKIVIIYNEMKIIGDAYISYVASNNELNIISASFKVIGALIVETT